MRPAASIVLSVILLLGVSADLSDAQPGAAGQISEPPEHQHDQAHDDHERDGNGSQSSSEEEEPVAPIPPLTDADRAAAFPDVEPHAMRDDAIHTFVLFDQLEWQSGDPASGARWDGMGWVGSDRDRLWFRTEGHSDDGRLENAEFHLFYGRPIARWWDLLLGFHQDFTPGPAQTWAAFGLQGLAPYWFEIELTGYVSDRGQTALRLEADYELLVTNRLVMRPLVELKLHGKSRRDRKIGSGLSEMDLGVRLRYEIRREVAPYLGVSWHNSFGATRDFAKAAGDKVSGVRVVTGVRLWY